MEKIPVRFLSSSQKDSNFPGSFSIRDLQDLLAGKDMVQELHRHNFFYILALKTGGGTHSIDFTPYKIRNNSVFVMRPGQVHQLTLKAGSTGYLMEFKNDFYPHDKNANQLLRKASTLNHHQLDVNRFKKLHPVLNNIFQEYAGKQDRYQEVIKANLGILFIELVRQNSIITPHNVDTYSQERLEEFLELLESHISDHKQVSHYADLLNLSPYQLNAITRATLEKTSSELINEYIILESRRYLLATSSQVTQIASHLGYEDVSYFIRFFKKHTGNSPEAFRQNFK